MGLKQPAVQARTTAETTNRGGARATRANASDPFQKGLVLVISALNTDPFRPF